MCPTALQGKLPGSPPPFTRETRTGQKQNLVVVHVGFEGPASSKEERLTIYEQHCEASLTAASFLSLHERSEPFPSNLSEEPFPLASHQPLVRWWGPLLGPDGPAAPALQAAH